MERLARNSTRDGANRVTRYLPASGYRVRRLTENSMAATNVRSTQRHHTRGTIVSAVALVMTEACSPCTLGLGAGSASGRMSGARMNKSPLERRSKPKLAAAECAGRLIG